MKYPALLLLFNFLISLSLISQESYSINKSDDFEITGKGDNENWNKTEWLELTQRKGHDNVTFKTRLKTLYSENGIYFGSAK